MAGGQGFEPRLTDPESAVLPLDDPPVSCPVWNAHILPKWPNRGKVCAAAGRGLDMTLRLANLGESSLAVFYNSMRSPNIRS